eukprot:777378-Pyramimonas_sp.AAC.1
MARKPLSVCMQQGAHACWRHNLKRLSCRLCARLSLESPAKDGLTSGTSWSYMGQPPPRGPM